MIFGIFYYLYSLECRITNISNSVPTKIDTALSVNFFKNRLELEGARESAYLAKLSHLNITTVKCRSFHRRAPPFLPVVYDVEMMMSHRVHRRTHRTTDRIS